jgi:hypothetical protein
MAIKQKPKNRKKAYKPKKVNLIGDSTSVAELASLGFTGMAKHISTLPQPKKYHLEMSWVLQDAENTLNMYCTFEGIDTESKGLMPLHVLQGAYKGDLIIALRENLIPEYQPFKIEITCKARRLDDPSVVVPVKPYRESFTDNPIPYAVFMSGLEYGKFYHKRQGGIKTAWKGLTKEWKLHLDEQYSDEYEIFDSKATLSCETYFRSQICEGIFKRMKEKRAKILAANGLAA